MVLLKIWFLVDPKGVIHVAGPMQLDKATLLKILLMLYFNTN